MCIHYDRNCELLCEQCCQWYICRFCHDNDNLEHKFDRHNINWIRCIECKTEQIKKQKCINQYCQIIFGDYYCNICSLFENNKKDIFHCDKCGICRIGKKKEYYHCDKCNGCYFNENKLEHKCIENAMKDDCCICLTDMFNSTDGVSILRCGHIMHNSCYKQYINTRRYITCPLCKECLIDVEKLKN